MYSSTIAIVIGCKTIEQNLRLLYKYAKRLLDFFLDKTLGLSVLNSSLKIRKISKKKRSYSSILEK